MADDKKTTKQIRYIRQTPIQVFFDKTTADMLDNFVYLFKKNNNLEFSVTSFDALEDIMIKEVLNHNEIEEMVNPYLERWIGLKSNEKNVFLLKVKPYLRSRL